jgi:hypothetical protein
VCSLSPLLANSKISPEMTRTTGKPWLRALLLGLLGIIGGPVLGQAPGADTKNLRIPKLEADAVIDGRLDDAVWAQAVTVSDLHQTFPIEYQTPTQRTEVRLFFTEEALYVAARMWETDTSQITAQVLRQGQGLGADDIFALIIDPYLDRRNGYRFEVNPNAVRWEGLFQNINDVEGNWEGIWEAGANTDEEGWTAEMKIPLQTISFNRDTDTWGINFVRARRREGESIAWVSRNREVNPSVAGTITGLEGLRQGFGLDVVPSLTLRQQKNFTPGLTPSDTFYEPQLDMFYKITPQLNAALTINTDFSATEVDDRQVNLTRFNLFFPEKRDFFLRDVDIFEFGQIGTGGFNQQSGVGTPAAPTPARQNARPFFSRKIGLSRSGAPVPIEAGVKLSGRVGDWNVGTLVVSQDEDPVNGVDGSNIFVGRAVLNVLSGSQVGVIATQGNPQSDLDNTLLGTDFRYRNSNLPGGKIVEGVAYYQQTDTEGRSNTDNAAWGLGVTLPNAQGWQGLYNYKRVEQNFNPAAGFVNQTGIEDHTFNVGWRQFLAPGGYWRSALGGWDFYRMNTLANGEVSSQNFGPRISANTNGGDTFFARVVFNREVLQRDFVINRASNGSRQIVIPAGNYEYTEQFIGMQLGGQRKLSANVFLTNGDYYNGYHFLRRGNFIWRPNRNLAFELGYSEDEITLPAGNFTVRQFTLNSQMAFSATMSWSNLIQYDNVSEGLGLNSRLHWIPRAGQQAFIVLNWGMTDADKDNTFQSVTGDLSLKFNYTFRF